MILNNFVISVGDLTNNPDKTHPGSSGDNQKRFVISSGDVGGGNLMNLYTSMGTTGNMTINDGSSSRTMSFTYGSSNDSQISIESDQSADEVEAGFVQAINGSVGGSIAVTAVAASSDGASDATIDLSHDSGGSITVSFNKNDASQAGSTYITITNTGTPAAGVAAAQDTITGSLDAAPTKPPVVGKITLRQSDSGDVKHLSSFNVVIDKDNITNDGSSIYVTGSLSGATEPDVSTLNSVLGDVLIIAEGY